ncbi:PAS domain S-box protein [candidate division KSB1 bacterium]
MTKPTYEELEIRIKKLETSEAEKRRIEQDLKNTLHWYEVIFENSRDAIFISSVDSTFVSVNRAACELTGYSKEELLRMKIPDLHEEIDLDAYTTFFDQIIAGEKILSEAKILRKDRSKVDTEFNNQRIEIQGTYYMHTVGRDISKRKYAENALKESETKYRTTVDSLIDPLHVIDRDYRIVLVNCEFREYAKQAGIDIEFIGKDIRDVFKFLPSKVIDEYEKVFRTKESLITEESNSFGGKEFITETHKVPIIDNGKVEGVITILRDETEQRNMENVLKESEDRLSTLLNNIPGMVFIGNPDWSIEFVKGCEEVSSFTSEEINSKEKGWLSVIHPDDLEEYYKDSMILKDRQKSISLIFRIITKSDDIRWMQEYKTSKFDKLGEFAGIDGIVFDVTDWKQTENLLRESEELYRQAIDNADAVAYKRDFASNSFAFIGKGISKLTGYHPEELTQDIWAQMIKDRVMRGRCAEMTSEEATTFTRDGKLKEWQADFRIIDRGGKERWLADSSVLLYDENGKPVSSLGILHDITERKKSEKQKTAIHEITQAVVESNDMNELFKRIHKALINVIDTTNIFIALNEEGTDLITFPYYIDEKDQAPPELHIKDSKSGTAKVILSGESMINTKQDYLDMLQKGKLKKHGSTSKVWLGVPLKTTERTIGALVVQSYSDPNLYSNEDIPFLEVIAGNIAVAIQRKKAMQLIQRSEERFRRLFNNAYDSIIIHELDGRIVNVNEKMLEMYNVSFERALSLTIADISSPDSSFDLAKAYWKRVVNGESVRFDWKAMRPDDKILFDVEVALDKFEIDGKDYIFGNVRDIAERKKAEEELKESEEHFRIMIERSPIGIQVFNIDGTLESANKAWADLWDIPDIDMVVGKYNALNDPQIEKMGLLDHIKKAFEGEVVEIPPAQYDPKDSGQPGQKRLVQVIAYPLKNNAGEVENVVIMNEDVTERRRAEEEKKRLEEQLIQSQKMESIGRLAGGIAHDFNNILTSVMGYAELLKMKFPEKSTHEGEAANIILKGAERAADLTKQLLGFARGGKYNPVLLNINEIIKDTIKVSEKIFEKNISIGFDFEQNIHTIEADSNQLNQVLTNLIINAKDAMPDGGRLTFKSENVSVDDDTEVELSNIANGDYIRLSVTDTGTGIPKNIREKIFEPFFTTKGKGLGTGLGLATVYGIVKNHNGYILVDSESGKSTTFTLYFPVSEKEIVVEKKEIHIRKGQATILVVDDEEYVRSLAAAMLKEIGYTVFLADNGIKAVEIYREKSEEIDLVLLDMIMPIMGGKETNLALKEINPDVKVILSSGYSQDSKATEILNEGAIGFIQKPYRMEKLSNAIAEALKE